MYISHWIVNYISTQDAFHDKNIKRQKGMDTEGPATNKKGEYSIKA